MTSVAFTNQLKNWERRGPIFLFYNITGQIQPTQFMSQSIGPFYQCFPHRLLTYLLLAACLICGTFLALGIAGKAAFMPQRLPLACTLAMYLAILFTFSHVLSDLAANHFWPSRMTYDSRSVGRQCLVIFSGVALGFWVHQGVFPELMHMCGQETDSHIPPMLLAAPLCCATLYACVVTVPMSEYGDEPNEAGPSKLEGEYLAPCSPPDSRAVIPGPAAASPTTVSFRRSGRKVTIPLEEISHVSMEDHYCRVYFRSGQGLENILVRETLKGLLSRVDSKAFVQIHRSHLVNKKHVASYMHKGRNHLLSLGQFKAPLPVSRNRRAKVKEALADSLVF